MKLLRKFSISICISFLMSGCSSVHLERVQPIAEIFVQFDVGQSVFNNRYALTERLNTVLAGYENRPLVVVVASGKDEDDFALAVSRMYSIVNSLDVDADFRVLVKPLERGEQKDRVALYHDKSWSSFMGNFSGIADHTLVEGSGGIYLSSLARIFMAAPKKQAVTLDHGREIEQMEDLLKTVGWKLKVMNSELFSIGSEDKKRVVLVTLGEVATEEEVELLLDGVFPDGRYVLDAMERVVKVYKVKSGW